MFYCDSSNRRPVSRNYESLHDPNAEYTMRELSGVTVGATATRGGGRDGKVTDVQCTMVAGETLFDDG